jgi:hypothetical protein
VGADSAHFYYLGTDTPGHSVLHKVTKSDGGFADSVYVDDSSRPMVVGCHSVAKTDTAIFFGISGPETVPSPPPTNHFVELAPGPSLVKRTVTALELTTQVYGYPGA